ncbi:MAG: CheR family methyltransferase [Candidatus Omnitrophota bacterium]
MPEKLKNIIEDVALDFLNIVLALRYDICTCDMCKNDMLAYVLSRVPAKYVTTEEGSLHTIIDQTKVEHQAQIGREIIKAIEVISKNPRHEVKEDREKSFELLLDKIYQDRGLDFRHYRRELLKRRIAVRLRANKLDLYSNYLRLLIKKPEEYDKLFEVLTINVSEFFRDSDVWVTLRIILENLIKTKKQNHDYSIKIWSAGCAKGEEAYSLAILMSNLLKTNNQLSFKVYGTDIKQECVRVARIAEYGKDYLKNVNADYLNAYFEHAGGKYLVKKEITELVEFRQLDLINTPHLENMDVVLCRNVFIYFSRSLQEALLMKFYKSLVKGGYLILGKVETILGEAKEIFHEINYGAKIYQKL